MPAQARISSIWKKQKLFVGLFVVAFGAYFFFDAMVGYPRSDARWLEHKRFQEEKRSSEWSQYAASRGWDAKPPEKFHGHAKIIEQYVFGGIVSLIGAVVLIYWATQKNRVLKSDAEAVYSPAGTRVPFDAITGLGKKRWESKGIAVVRYQIAARKGQFVIDDYKFETEPARKILEEIEEKLRTRG